MAELESHPDPAVRTSVTTLLQGIDAVHRTALTHLVGAIHSMAGEAFMNRLTADPAIRLLLMSYDLIAVDRRLHAEEALDSVRGHLHEHGIDVELSDVLGGAVFVTLHGIERSDVAIDGVRHDLEEALRAVDVDGHGILIVNVDGEFLAVSNQCGESPLPLQFSALDGPELRCRWHGCRYDVRSGQRLDGGPERLTVFPVSVEGGEVRVAIGTEPVTQA